MNGLLQKLNETVVTRRGSTSGSAISSTFGSVFSTTASSAAAAAAAATPGAPSVIYPCSVRPIPFTVPTFPSMSVVQPPGRSPNRAAAVESAGSRPGRTGSSNYVGVDNNGRGDFYADYRGKKYIVTHLDQSINQSINQSVTSSLLQHFFNTKSHVRPISQLRFDFDTTIPRRTQLRRK